MSVIVKQEEKKEEPKKAKTPNKYVPHLFRSHPFYFIRFPLYLILTTMFYWIIWVPLCYSLIFVKLQGEALAWAVPFFIIALTGYLLILAAYIFQWKTKEKDQKNDVFYEFTKELYDSESSSSSSESSSSSDSDETKSKNSEEEGEKETKNTCPAKRQKRRPDTLKIETSRPVSQNVCTSLTPRDLFFIDFINNSYENDKQYTQQFIERESGIFDMSPTTPCVSKSPKSSQTTNSPGLTEYFIANISEDKVCKSEAFLFVDENKDEKDCQVIEMKLKGSRGPSYLID